MGVQVAGTSYTLPIPYWLEVEVYCSANGKPGAYPPESRFPMTADTSLPVSPSQLAQFLPFIAAYEQILKQVPQFNISGSTTLTVGGTPSITKSKIEPRPNCVCFDLKWELDVRASLHLQGFAYKTQLKAPSVVSRAIQWITGKKPSPWTGPRDQVHVSHHEGMGAKSETTTVCCKKSAK